MTLIEYVAEVTKTSAKDWKSLGASQTASTHFECFVHVVTQQKIEVFHKLNGDMGILGGNPVAHTSLTAQECVDSYFNKGLPSKQDIRACSDIPTFFEFSICYDYLDESEKKVIRQHLQQKNTYVDISGFLVLINPINGFEEHARKDYNYLPLLEDFLPSYLSLSEQGLLAINSPDEDDFDDEYLPPKKLLTCAYRDFVKKMESAGFKYQPNACFFASLYPYI